MYFVVGLHGHGTSRLARRERRADRVQAGTKSPSVAEHVERGAAHARHDPHVDDDVGRVGELDADLRDRRAERAHAERDHVHRAAAHRSRRTARAASPASRPGAPSCWSARRLLRLRADEGAVLDARDVAGIGAGPEAVRAQLSSRRVKVPARRARRTAARTRRRCRRTSAPGRAGAAAPTPRPTPAGACAVVADSFAIRAAIGARGCRAAAGRRRRNTEVPAAGRRASAPLVLAIAKAIM